MEALNSSFKALGDHTSCYFEHGVYDVYTLGLPEAIVDTPGRVFSFYRAHTSVLFFLVLPLPLTYRTNHGVHISIERATSGQPLKHPSIICIPYVAGGGWELYIQRVISKRLRDNRHRGEQLVTLPYLKLSKHNRIILYYLRSTHRRPPNPPLQQPKL